MIRASRKAKSHFMDDRARLWIRAESKRCSGRSKADANGKLSWFEAIEGIEGRSQEESCAGINRAGRAERLFYELSLPDSSPGKKRCQRRPSVRSSSLLQVKWQSRQ